MITEQDLFFSDGQTPTGNVATIPSTNDLDLLSAYGEAIPEPLWLVICAQVAAASAGAATVQFQLQTSADDNTWVTLWTSAAFPVASVVAGFSQKLHVPVGALRYLRVNYIVGTAALTAGTFQALLSDSVDVMHPV